MLSSCNRMLLLLLLLLLLSQPKSNHMDDRYPEYDYDVSVVNSSNP